MGGVRRNLGFLLCGAVLVPTGARAPYPKVSRVKPGGVTGEVVNAKGAPVKGALILWQVADGSTPHILHSDAQGHFRSHPLRAGLYELRASAGGAWSEWEHNVAVRPGTEANVKLRLSFKAPAIAAAIELKGAMRTWDLPASGALPHDPAVDPKG